MTCRATHIHSGGKSQAAAHTKDTTNPFLLTGLLGWRFGAGDEKGDIHG